MDDVQFDVQFDEQRIIPVVVQDSVTRTVLFLGYMNQDALRATQTTGLLHLWSRSRKYLRVKGERSGHYQGVEEIRLNCEGNSLLVLVHPQGPACHNGYESCFYRRLDIDGGAVIIEPRLFDPKTVYGDGYADGYADG